MKKCKNQICNNEVKRKRSKYCSCSCAQSSIEVKQKQRISHLGKKRTDMIGEKNPSKRPEVKEKISKARINKGIPHSEESKKKISIANRGKTYEERYGSKTAKKMKEERRQACLNGHAQDMCSKIVSPSKPQIELFNKIIKIFDNDNVQLEYRFGNYSLDIAIPDKKIDIEYDCSYWHSKEKDKKRDDFMKSKGWKVFRFVDRIPTSEEIFQAKQAAIAFANDVA